MASDKRSRKAATPRLAPLTTTTTIAEQPEPVDTKKPTRTLSKALRSMSNPAIESTGTQPTRTSNSFRRSKAGSSGSGSMIERIQRRLSKDSTISLALSDTSPMSPAENSYSSMDLIQHGPLRPDPSVRKSRPEYLVLTEQCLVKCSSIEAARGLFPQLLASSSPPLQRSASTASMQSKHGRTEPKLEIPLDTVTAVFNDGLSSSRCDLDVWWTSQDGRSTSYRSLFAFESAMDMEEWLAIIHRTCRAKVRMASAPNTVPSAVRDRVYEIVKNTEPVNDDLAKVPIFPVVKRPTGSIPAAPSTDDSRWPIQLSSYYLAIGPYMCYLVEVMQPEPTESPADLRTKSTPFGTVTLTRFRASVATHTQSFIMVFKQPFGRDIRLDLASVHYRRIIDVLIKADRVLKPMWPQHLQSTIFEIRGLPPPLQLTSGNDLGGLETSLPAYCAAYHVAMPEWWIDWNIPSQPCFCLIPSPGEPYSAMQLLAVFRALRYNSFFKAISFENVDLSALLGQKDMLRQGDGIVQAGSKHAKLTDDEFDALLHATIFEQEIHSLFFATDSIRSINFNNTLGAEPIIGASSLSVEFIRPLVWLMRRDILHCHNLYFSNVPLPSNEVDDLAIAMVMDHVHIRRLDLSHCDLGDLGLTKLWTALAAQASTLEAVDTSNNRGFVREDTMRQTLNQLRGLSTLRIANNTRVLSDAPLFDFDAIKTWPLEVLDLSGILLNDATVDVLAQFLATDTSFYLRSLQLNHCGLTGRQVAHLFRSMGVSRELSMHIEASRLDNGIEELCEVIIDGSGPWSLFAQMVDFAHEEAYVNLLRALTKNTSIRCLSLAGSSIPDDASDVACKALHEFFTTNATIQFLDMSGYESKLDEGRLGRGFSKALAGLKDNTSIEHLRIRSQMLNLNVGDIADAITENKTMRTLDCEFNDFNLSNYRHLIKSMKENTRIQLLSAFAAHELQDTIQRSVDNAAAQTVPSRRTSVMARFKPEKNATAGDKSLVQDLRAEWEAASQELAGQLGQNQVNPAGGREVVSQYNHLDWAYIFASEFGGLALQELHYRDQQLQPAPMGMPVVEESLAEDADANVHRSKSTNSSDSAGTHSTDAGSSGTPSTDVTGSDSDLPTPVDLRSVGSPGLEPASDDTEFDVYTDAQETIFSEPAEIEGGLQMKRYHRFGDDPTNTIDEEEV